MANLVDLDNRHTDKNTAHSYLPLYDRLLSPLRTTARAVLEVGIGDFKRANGGSLLLWRRYFAEATVYGIDILPIDRVLSEVRNDESIVLHTRQDAYDPAFVQREFADKGMKFDFMIDDGPHTLRSMTDFIRLYSPLLTEDGLLAVEDVQDPSWIHSLAEATPGDLRRYIKVHDLRHVKGRYDDLVFTIDKTPTSERRVEVEGVVI